MTRGWFVTGTDTGVGKTVVSCGIARACREQGLDVGVMKPSETGVEAAGPLDAQALRDAAGCEDPLELICPQTFAMPAAPTVAAAAEATQVDPAAIRSAWKTLAARHEVMVVEGAGGLLVPVWDGARMADLAAELGLPVVVVARAALGTINHTLLTLEALEQRGLPLAGVVISHATGVLTTADEANVASLRRALGPRLVGEVLPLAAGSVADAQALGLPKLLTAAGL